MIYHESKKKRVHLVKKFPIEVIWKLFKFSFNPDPLKWDLRLEIDNPLKYFPWVFAHRGLYHIALQAYQSKCTSKHQTNHLEAWHADVCFLPVAIVSFSLKRKWCSHRIRLCLSFESELFLSFWIFESTCYEHDLTKDFLEPKWTYFMFRIWLFL